MRPRLRVSLVIPWLFVAGAQAQFCHPDETWSDPFVDQTVTGSNREQIYQNTVAYCMAQCCSRTWCIGIEYRRSHINKQCNLLEVSHLDGTHSLEANAGWDYYYKGPNVGDYTTNNNPACAGGGTAATGVWYERPGEAIKERNVVTHNGYTVDACKIVCCQTWWCNSFEHFASTNQCQLTPYVWYEVEFYSVTGVNYYQAAANMPPSPPRAPSLGYVQPALQLSWDNAAATCEGLGGMLAVPHNQAEWDAMVASRITVRRFGLASTRPRATTSTAASTVRTRGRPTPTGTPTSRRAARIDAAWWRGTSRAMDGSTTCAPRRATSSARTRDRPCQRCRRLHPRRHSHRRTRRVRSCRSRARRESA